MLLNSISVGLLPSLGDISISFRILISAFITGLLLYHFIQLGRTLSHGKALWLRARVHVNKNVVFKGGIEQNVAPAVSLFFIPVVYGSMWTEWWNENSWKRGHQGKKTWAEITHHGFYWYAFAFGFVLSYGSSFHLSSFRRTWTFGFYSFQVSQHAISDRLVVITGFSITWFTWSTRFRPSSYFKQFFGRVGNKMCVNLTLLRACLYSIGVK